LALLPLAFLIFSPVAAAVGNAATGNGRSGTPSGSLSGTPGGSLSFDSDSIPSARPLAATSVDIVFVHDDSDDFAYQAQYEGQIKADDGDLPSDAWKVRGACRSMCPSAAASSRHALLTTNPAPPSCCAAYGSRRFELLGIHQTTTSTQ
jgi:hypothetical protein